MAYIGGDGSIRRERLDNDTNSRLNALLCAVALVAAVAVGTVPSVADLREQRVREDGLWFAPPVSAYHHVGVLALARAPVRRRRGAVLHVGAFGSWVALTGAYGLPSWARDDASVLLALMCAVYLVQIARPRPWLSRHFLAARSNVSAGRPWCLVLSALAHGDAIHFAMNGLALARVAPRLDLGGGGDRRRFWAFCALAAASASSASLLYNRCAGRPRHACRGASGVAFAMLAYEASRAPHEVTSFYGVCDLPASSALAASLAVDALIRSSGGVDAASHFGGAAFGYAAEAWVRRFL